MLVDVTNHHLSDILLQRAHLHTHTSVCILLQILRENKASSQSNGALTLRPRPGVASLEGRWHLQRDGRMDRGRDRSEDEEVKQEGEGRGRAHWRLKHWDEIRFSSNDIMLLTRFGLLVPAQHKFHWSHMENRLLVNTTWWILAAWGTMVQSYCWFTYMISVSHIQYFQSLENFQLSAAKHDYLNAYSCFTQLIRTADKVFTAVSVCIILVSWFNS